MHLGGRLYSGSQLLCLQPQKPSIHSKWHLAARVALPFAFVQSKQAAGPAARLVPHAPVSASSHSGDSSYTKGQSGQELQSSRGAVPWLTMALKMGI